jgi:hypothetical protein
MPPCDPAASDRTRACWYLVPDAAMCPAPSGGAYFEVDWGGSATCGERLPPPGARVTLQYVSQP